MIRHSLRPLRTLRYNCTVWVQPTGWERDGMLIHLIPLSPTFRRTIYLDETPCQEKLFRFIKGFRWIR